ncbi:methionine-rich copper-binding protein CopC [Arthrobacter stackebrandtii]|uniref:Methionine-rich copper-binding protein CopC n=1 Tax=Arthrobacter stackebrandtii TaxID=272161 RepID=A0ABS4YWF8_9MICC|nr:copper resistance CopC family protein [Arthrobacter stackebrandtii]MBP2412935.1 methionine-rich copper-binding protein CopC [Arthrobacter stackebrandtii]
MTSKFPAVRILAGVLVLLLMLFGSVTAASAHDAVTGTAPSDGETVDTVPEQVTVTMSNTPATIGSEIQVVDGSGTNWATGPVDVLDQTATQAIKPGAPAGEYTVKWRLVSSDSHPIEGEFTFTATAAGTGQVVGAGPMVSVKPVPEKPLEQVKDESSVPWSVIGLFVVLVGVVIAMVIVARRRLGRDE